MIKLVLDNGAEISGESGTSLVRLVDGSTKPIEAAVEGELVCVANGSSAVQSIEAI